LNVCYHARHYSNQSGYPALFSELDERLLKAVKEAGFETPTQVQTETFEPALDGQDLFVSAETGSGKTCAYLLPAFERLLEAQQKYEIRSIRMLVMVPTRELAQQVLKQAKQLGRYTPLKLGHIGGGTDINKQNDLVKEPAQFLVATPGRLSELLARDEIDLSSVEILILDEADRLLDMGFAEEIDAIAAHCAHRTQTQFYSATLGHQKLHGLAEALLDEPRIITLNQVSDVHSSIRQQIVFADDKEHKAKILAWLLTHESFQHCLVFCNSKEQADRLYGLMWQQGISCGVLHGDREQKQRNLVMSKLRRDEIKVLIATDIAARGLDIEGMDLVINFEMPRRGEIYVHRIGRTGRAGQSGAAITLIMAPEYNLMSGIERFLKQSFERRRIKDVAGNYQGPKKLKASGKAASTKKKDKSKKKAKAKAKIPAKKNVWNKQP
jgi:superfamily II DNA/RNA helicase